MLRESHIRANLMNFPLIVNDHATIAVDGSAPPMTAKANAWGTNSDDGAGVDDCRRSGSQAAGNMESGGGRVLKRRFQSGFAGASWRAACPVRILVLAVHLTAGCVIYFACTKY
jgi:hypothetical protein